MIKLSITKISQDWIEATWTEEVATTSIIENEADGNTVEETVHNTETTILHCESFSGHREHIEMLKDKCLEFNTELTEEYKVIVNEISEAYVYPTEEELQAEVIKNKVQEAKIYLASTDYKMTVDYFATLTEAEQVQLTQLRAEAREFIRTNEGEK